MREKIQQYGAFLAGMVVPNIGAFIAWGLITALFIPTGWIPQLFPDSAEWIAATFEPLVGPIIVNLLPILIGYTGGKMVYGHRGGVVGAVATMGVVVGSSIPQFMGGMLMGPVGGYLIMKIDEALEEKIPVGFELLVNNFTAGILGMLLAMLGAWLVGGILDGISEFLGGIVDSLVEARLLPLADLIIEPAKVLFFNNAINHGILTPLGVEVALEKGRAIHFLLETNPGPGLGLLGAYYVAGKGLLKDSAPGAAIIHFLGGIHEIYFPYVLAHPIMILAMYAGGILADIWFMIFDAGLVAGPSPGSIFAYFAVMPSGQFFPVMGGVTLGVVGSFVVGTILLRAFPVKAVTEDEDYDEEMELELA